MVQQYTNEVEAYMVAIGKRDSENEKESQILSQVTELAQILITTMSAGGNHICMI